MTYFKEEQYFRQKLLWLVILFFPTFSLYGIYEQVLMGNVIGDKPLSDGGLVSFSLIIGLGLPVAFWFMKLKLRVSEKGYTISFFPFILRNALLLLKKLKVTKPVPIRPSKSLAVGVFVLVLKVKPTTLVATKAYS